MKVLIVEDHPIVVSGCRQLFAEHTNFAFFDARTVAEARQSFAQHVPDVLVIDVNLPDGSGLEFVQDVRRHNSTIGVVVFSMSDDPMLALKAIDLGARGFVSKNGSSADLIEAVEAVAHGRTWLPEDLLQQVALMRADPASRPPQLTRREKSVLKLLVGGRFQSEIAKELNISSKLVSTDCAVIRQKLNARTTAEMVAIAMKFNLQTGLSSAVSRSASSS